MEKDQRDTKSAPSISKRKPRIRLSKKIFEELIENTKKTTEEFDRVLQKQYEDILQSRAESKQRRYN